MPIFFFLLSQNSECLAILALQLHQISPRLYHTTTETKFEERHDLTLFLTELWIAILQPFLETWWWYRVKLEVVGGREYMSCGWASVELYLNALGYRCQPFCYCQHFRSWILGWKLENNSGMRGTMAQPQSSTTFWAQTDNKGLGSESRSYGHLIFPWNTPTINDLRNLRSWGMLCFIWRWMLKDGLQNPDSDWASGTFVMWIQSSAESLVSLN